MCFSVNMNIEVASSDDVDLVLVSDGFGRGLEAHISFLRGKEVPPQSSLASREERSQCEKWESGWFSWRIFCSLVSSGCIPERQPFMKVRH